MLIRIEYCDQSYDMVQSYYLESLIANRHIRRFRREGGWVEVGRDRLRGDRIRRYTGPERRVPIPHRPLDAPVRINGRLYRPQFGGQLTEMA